ncbi:hypothetical protein BC938DRAFT_475974 [Jimgerdemannia flammicorona]|uniref:carboxypeptidase C n=1 Tax=Jimgerdemannia flammicorona TaxID=994334 RepID=A0A433QR12_9FUNG|nr:hypothetical protein BC938DRAFT_475974 [Jimgerdemannia flammicorona]
MSVMIFTRPLAAVASLSAVIALSSLTAHAELIPHLAGLVNVGRLVEQKLDGLNAIWNPKVDEILDNVGKKVGGVVDGIMGEDKKADEWVNVFTHPAFPEYTFRYKEPALCDPNIAGYLDVSSDKHFFFWFFESRNKPATDPLILWLNGGPGCSSLTGLFMELGWVSVPCMVSDDGSDTTVNPYSWNANASVVFLDQPLNVGYSYGSGSATNTVAAAKDSSPNTRSSSLISLVNLVCIIPLDATIRSHDHTIKRLFTPSNFSLDFTDAGHYIPAIAEQIHGANKGHFTSLTLREHASTLKPVNLASLLIGNGLTDPYVQYKYYAEMGCNSTYGAVLDERTCSTMRDAYPACARLIQNCYDSQNVFSCLPAASKCNKDHIQPYQQTGKNLYDVRKECKGGNLCYEILGAIQTYLNREDVKNELGVKVTKYESCNMEINFRFQLAGDWMRPYHRSLNPVLEDGIRVLIYAGDADFICNWYGNKAWTLELPWKGQKEFQAAADRDWVSDITGEVAGEVRSTADGQFTFLRVFGAGHMVPYDQPANSLDFLNKWINKQKF